MWTQIAQAISEATGKDFAIADTRSVGGGCINQGYKISDNNTAYFVKLNQASQLEMFAAEALGLNQMYATQTITVPQPVCWGTANDSSYIVLQWLDLGRGNSQSWTEMGRQLAAMHREGMSNNFGWERNNTIGSTPQINTETDNWADFFAEHRIGYQLKLAKRRGGSFPDTNKVVNAVRNKLADRQPQASLVHGDLWSGNAAISSDGSPVILDPATYYGDRETDIAMTELFGGFPAAFYHGYNEAWQLDSGYQHRKNIYNLYHILNHFNLFGGGYANQAKRMINNVVSSS
ncbi:fructosamine kinase family protein [Pleurocapsa sp. PCC 7319]|uniref:fructosamine kinase family protein n=1 Tax=Pleurocapsa sp. PCC 7319 TaxID=118161 RepID=UPI00034B76F9|nr:fructosamine kinase family protein [Pleurocapsa sp. PCC 7319]